MRVPIMVPAQLHRLNILSFFYITSDRPHLLFHVIKLKNALLYVKDGLAQTHKQIVQKRRKVCGDGVDETFRCLVKFLFIDVSDRNVIFAGFFEHRKTKIGVEICHDRDGDKEIWNGGNGRSSRKRDADEQKYI